jgi:hypothetical protein
MAAFCERRHGGTASLLGDAATDLLGADASLERIEELLAGAAAATTQESDMISALRRAATALEFDIARLLSRRAG